MLLCGQVLKRPRENVEQVMEIVLVKGNKGRLHFRTCSQMLIVLIFLELNTVASESG